MLLFNVSMCCVQKFQDKVYILNFLSNVIRALVNIFLLFMVLTSYGIHSKDKVGNQIFDYLKRITGTWHPFFLIPLVYHLMCHFFYLVLFFFILSPHGDVEWRVCRIRWSMYHYSFFVGEKISLLIWKQEKQMCGHKTLEIILRHSH